MLKNWKTTLAGLGAGVLNVIANGTSFKQLGLSLLLAILGVVAKDHNQP